MDVIAKREAFITLKDHKENFENSLLCRLINLAKSEMGLVSKRILDSINGRLKENLDVTLWKKLVAVIEWFRSIEMKENCTFTNFDIVEFYPTISEDLLNSAISFGKRHFKFTSKEVDIIHHSTKSLLFSDDKASMKKQGSGLFDVAMGSYEGAEQYARPGATCVLLPYCKL